jgi:hypothetical protein
MFRWLLSALFVRLLLYSVRVDGVGELLSLILRLWMAMMRNTPKRPGQQGLMRAPCGFYGEVEFVFGAVQQLLGFGAVTVHVVVVGGTGAIHFMDGLGHVFVDFVQIVPVVNRCGNGCARGES